MGLDVEEFEEFYLEWLLPKDICTKESRLANISNPNIRKNLRNRLDYAAAKYVAEQYQLKLDEMEGRLKQLREYIWQRAQAHENK